MNIQKRLIERRLLPICAHCKRVRSGTDHWEQIEAYMLARFGLEFTHTLCPTHLDQDIADISNLPDVMGSQIAETSASDNKPTTSEKANHERRGELVYETIIKAFETLKAEHEALANWIKDFAEAASDRRDKQNG